MSAFTLRCLLTGGLHGFPAIQAQAASVPSGRAAQCQANEKIATTLSNRRAATPFLATTLTLLLVALWTGDAAAFALLGSKWGDSDAFGTPGGTVTYSFAPGGTLLPQVFGSPVRGIEMVRDPVSVFGADYESVFADAFNQWSSVANIDFLVVPDNGSRYGLFSPSGIGEIRIGAIPFASGVASGFAALSISEGYDFSAGRGIVADIFFNSLLEWAPGGHDHDYVLNTALHEIGHSIGLDHSDVPRSIMRGFIGDVLQPDDIAGAQFIYGARTVAVTEPATAALLGIGLLGFLSMQRARRRWERPC
jgi:hypothetical protein